MSAYELVVVGASWGGFGALGRLLADLPRDFGAAVAVAQHRGPDSAEAGLAEVLGRKSTLPVREAHDKDAILPGRVYLAPPDYHLLVEREGTFALSTDAPEQHSRPSIDVLFESAAEAYGSRVVGVVLTGASPDGAAGLARIRRGGGFGLVQDPATADRSAMPEAAIARAGADEVVALPQIAPLLARLCGPGVAATRGEHR